VCDVVAGFGFAISRRSLIENGGLFVLDYEKLYKILFNGIVDAINSMEEEICKEATENYNKAEDDELNRLLAARMDQHGKPIYLLRKFKLDGTNEKKKNWISRLFKSSIH
jgi:hypothetical protein